MKLRSPKLIHFAGLVTLPLLVAGCNVASPSVSDASSAGAAASSPEAVSAGSATQPAPREMERAATSASPLIGRAAPAFTLRNDQDQLVTLESFRGQWLVLYFYPQDDTPGCTCQATEFTDLLRHFHDLGAQVAGVSPDSPGSHRFFREKYGLRITLLSDEDHAVMRTYGAWAEYGQNVFPKGRVIRSTFLIDPEGRIAWHWPEVIPTGHATRVKEKVKQLQAARGAPRG